jgi:hypothetical protein
LERGGNEEKEFQTSSGASGVAQVAEHLFNKPEAQYCKKKKTKKPQNSQASAHTCNPAWEAEMGRINVQGQSTSLQDPLSQITRAKWTGGMAQAVKHLLCKYLLFKCSNPSPTKGKKNPKQNS